jgi:hypothetical protein
MQELCKYATVLEPLIGSGWRATMEVLLKPVVRNTKRNLDESTRLTDRFYRVLTMVYNTEN